MNRLVIRNGKCVTPFEIIEDSIIVVEGNRIVYVGNKYNYSISNDTKEIDAEGKFVSPGFIDIQINGGGGSDALDGTFDAYNQIIDYHLKSGVTSLLLTLVSTSIDKLMEALTTIRKFKKEKPLGKFVLGTHLEGPYISPLQLGAHNPKFMAKPDVQDYEKYYEYADIIKIVTEAPEIPGVIDFCSGLVKRGVVASIGHSDAAFDEVVKAIHSGFTMVTHIYSVMSTIKRKGLDKIPGVVEAALLLDDLWVEVINDGQHLPEPLFNLVLKNKGINKIILSSDAIRAAGLKDGKYTLGGKDDNHQILVKNGIAMTIDKKLYAGSTTTMNQGVRNAIKFGRLNIQDAVAMATINPANLLNLENEIGSISIGKKANIILFDDNINVNMVMHEGKIVYDQEGKKIPT